LGVGAIMTRNFRLSIVAALSNFWTASMASLLDEYVRNAKSRGFPDHGSIGISIFTIGPTSSKIDRSLDSVVLVVLSHPSTNISQCLVDVVFDASLTCFFIPHISLLDGST